MTTKTPAQHLAILKAHNAWRRGATRKLEASPEEIGEAIDCAIGVMEAQANCTRSHPHELMSPACELRTQLAKAHNENAHLQAERDALKAKLKADLLDAQRYRLLRDESINEISTLPDVSLVNEGNSLTGILHCGKNSTAQQNTDKAGEKQ
jgi:regulator of replication initiation timing